MNLHIPSPGHGAMSEDEWANRDWPGAMIDALLNRDAVRKPAEQRLRLFGCAVCRRIDRLLTDELRHLVEHAEERALANAPASRYRAPARELRTWLQQGAFTGARYYAACAVLHLLEGDARAAMSLALSASLCDPDAPARLDADCAGLLRCLFGNPFRAGAQRPAAQTRRGLLQRLFRFTDDDEPAFPAAWRTDTVLALAREMYATRDFGAMPVLADALQDAGCDDEDVLAHCRDERTRGDARTAGATIPVHARGCWVVDLVLGPE